MLIQRFINHVVVITGAAKGIGRACAERFAHEGARVVCLDIDEENNAYTREICKINQPDILCFSCDVRDKKQVKNAIDKTKEHWGRIDTLVTSAGIYSGAALPKVSLAQWENTLTTNLTGIFLCNQVVVPFMQEQQAGSIINISSMSGKTSYPATAEYSASKSGIIGFTRSVAMELAPYGVTANTVCPGNTITDMLNQVAETVGPSVGISSEKWLEARAADCPLGRFAKPAEIAGVVAFLASEDARYITGQAIEVDGGMILS